MASAGVIWAQVRYWRKNGVWLLRHNTGASIGKWLPHETRSFSGLIEGRWCFPAHWNDEKRRYDFRVPDTRTEIDWRNG